MFLALALALLLRLLLLSMIATDQAQGFPLHHHRVSFASFPGGRRLHAVSSNHYNNRNEGTRNPNTASTAQLRSGATTATTATTTTRANYFQPSFPYHRPISNNSFSSKAATTTTTTTVNSERPCYVTCSQCRSTYVFDSPSDLKEQLTVAVQSLTLNSIHPKTCPVECCVCGRQWDQPIPSGYHNSNSKNKDCRPDYEFLGNTVAVIPKQVDNNIISNNNNGVKKTMTLDEIKASNRIAKHTVCVSNLPVFDVDNNSNDSNKVQELVASLFAEYGVLSMLMLSRPSAQRPYGNISNNNSRHPWRESESRGLKTVKLDLWTEDAARLAVRDMHGFVVAVDAAGSILTNENAVLHSSADNRNNNKKTRVDDRSAVLLADTSSSVRAYMLHVEMVTSHAFQG